MIRKSLKSTELPTEFHNAQNAMEFIIKTPTLATYGGYDSASMNDETIVDFANEIPQQLKLVSYKYRNCIKGFTAQTVNN